MTVIDRRHILECIAWFGVSGRASLPAAAMVAPPSSLIHRIAIAATSLTDEIPDDVSDRVAWAVFDAIGTSTYAASQAEAGPFLAEMAALRSIRSARVLGHSGNFAPAYAAAAQACLIHWAEIDDTENLSQLRPSAVALSAAIVGADAYDVSGPRFLRSAALAYTLQERLARPFGLLQGRGWMTTGVWGPIAAAAAIAAQRGFPVGQAQDAMALAALSSGGLFQYYFDQTEDKRVIVARAARVAVESAQLASDGFHGAPRIFEGEAGIFATIGGKLLAQDAMDQITENLSQLEGPLHVQPKFFAASHSIIPTIEAIKRSFPFPFPVDLVSRFIIRGDASIAQSLGKKVAHFEPPATKIGAAVNYSYATSLFLVRGSLMPWDYDQLPDERAVRLAQLAEFETAPLKRAMQIELTLKDGRVYSTTTNSGDFSGTIPLDADRRKEKFAALTRGIIPNSRIEQILRHCLAIKQQNSMSRWFDTLGILTNSVGA